MNFAPGVETMTGEALDRKFPYRYIRGDGMKMAGCPVCEREWEVGRPGGGMVIAGIHNHIRVCRRKAVRKANILVGGK